MVFRKSLKSIDMHKNNMRKVQTDRHGPKINVEQSGVHEK